MLESQTRNANLGDEHDSEDQDEQQRDDQSELEDRLPALVLHRPRERTNRPHQTLNPSIVRRQNGIHRARYRQTAARLTISRKRRHSRVSSSQRIGATSRVTGSRRSGGTSCVRTVSTTRSAISWLTRLPPWPSISSRGVAGRERRCGTPGSRAAKSFTSPSVARLASTRATPAGPRRGRAPPRTRTPV